MGHVRGLLDENGVPLRMNKMMIADSVSSIAGAISGTSSIIIFLESSAGVSVGGRTGLTALVTSVCFFISLFLSPLARLVPRCATASALIWIGVLMVMSVTKVDWSNTLDAAVAFMTIFMIPFGYSISTGIGVGILFYIGIAAFSGRIREITIAVWVVGVLFLAMFLLT